MCGRFTLTFTLEEIEKEFDLTKEDYQWKPSYNVAPSQYSPVILQNKIRQLSMVRWGLTLQFKKINQTRQVINIRKETLTDKHSFDFLLKSKRCIIPANGFFEWEKGEAKGKKSIPYYFQMMDHTMFAFAGLWNEQGDQTEKINEYAIITCPANEVVGKFHERMPVIMDKSAQESWLSDGWSKEKLTILCPYPKEKMKFHMVTSKVNNPDYNHLDCVDPIPIQHSDLGY